MWEQRHWQMHSKKNSTLIFLNIARNKIGDAGARSISCALEINASLEQLYLNDNEIGDGGKRMLSNALKRNTAATELYLKARIERDRLSQKIILHELRTNQDSVKRKEKEQRVLYWKPLRMLMNYSDYEDI